MHHSLIRSTPNHSQFLQDFLHVIQFCHLSVKGKVSPISFSMNMLDDIKTWVHSARSSIALMNPIPWKCSNITRPIATSPTDFSNLPSPEQKMSHKDNYFINAMLKLNESVGNNILKGAKEKEDKEPGFSSLEVHKNILILYNSLLLPFDMAATDYSKRILQGLPHKKEPIQGQRYV